jgi:hypothetical protein
MTMKKIVPYVMAAYLLGASPNVTAACQGADCGDQNQHQEQRQEQNQTLENHISVCVDNIIKNDVRVGGGTTTKTHIPPGFVQPFPGNGIPEGYMSKESKTKYVFNDIPYQGDVLSWNVIAGRNIYIVPSGDLFFYQQWTLPGPWSLIKLKDQPAWPYRQKARFTEFGKKETIAREAEPLESVEVGAIRGRLEDIVKQSRGDLFITMTVDPQPQSRTTGISGGASISGSPGEKTTATGGITLGSSSQHMTSRCVVVFTVYEKAKVLPGAADF